jgi:hypothetical protein
MEKFGLQIDAVAAHSGIDFSGPGVKTALQAAHILQPVPHKIRRGVEGLLALVI